MAQPEVPASSDGGGDSDSDGGGFTGSGASGAAVQVAGRGGGGGDARRCAAAAAPFAAARPLRAHGLDDWYRSALLQGAAWGFAGEKMSALLHLARATHAAAASQRLTVGASFGGLRSAVLRLAVQRPPFSVGVFQAGEVRAVLLWFLDTYYRHYKLYQCAYTSRVSVDAAASHPWDGVEAPPSVALALRDAATEDRHRAQLELERCQRVREAAASAAAAAAASEADRARQLECKYEAAVPDGLRERVSRAVEHELAYLRAEMEREFGVCHAGLLEKVKTIERQEIGGGCSP